MRDRCRNMSSISVAPKLTFCTFFKKIMKTNIILTFCSFIKIHLEKCNFFFSHVWDEMDVQLKSCRTSAVVLTKKKTPLHLRVFINREVRAVFRDAPTFSLFEKKMLVAPAPLTNSTKHIVRPQRRCSCEIDGTSAVPLLAIHETSVKSS